MERKRDGTSHRLEDRLGLAREVTLGISQRKSRIAMCAIDWRIDLFEEKVKREELPSEILQGVTKLGMSGREELSTDRFIKYVNSVEYRQMLLKEQLKIIQNIVDLNKIECD
ncbi:hypothetical protein TSAR_002506 [Trichomalopsis sarcophagae]|uniref:Uncharacterized protein n=1 Tax=Trichomalopsis sarcophagae TaxID=543379 RepID=A0A232EHU7_9HYME|nr:hypothetical protein TSAR_002506 [Trichomalopsis sarcophagae]